MNYFTRKKFRVVLLALLLFLTFPLHAINTSDTRTINVTTAGKLPTLLPQNERGYVVTLTLTGKLNGTDFNVLRAMATDQKLQNLDLSGANIVKGGESYYTNYSTNHYTEDDEFGYSLFNGCKKIQKIVLPNSLVTIGKCAFWYCTSLKTLVIGSKVTTIEPGLWGGCSSLTDVQLNNSNFHLTNGILYNKNYTTIIAALLTWDYGDLIIRSGVKEIQYEAFSFSRKLTSVTFPSSVTTIGTTAFEYTGITSVKFTSAITSIGSFAFSGCKSLKELDLTTLNLTSLDYGVFMTSNIEVVYLPKTLKELKQSVFSNTPLKHLFAYTATPATIYDLTTSSPTFKDVDTESCIVHVPQGKVNTYKAAAGWKDFFYITDNQEIESEKEAYAVYTDDGTLTFYYDNSKSSRSGTKYAMNTGNNEPGWYSEHQTDIKKVIFNSSFSSARPTSTYSWFAGESTLNPSFLAEIVGLEYLNTSEVTDMRYMFSYCQKLANLDVSHFDTSNVTDMGYMFFRCWLLTDLDVSHFDTSKVRSMYNMFFMCSNLKSLDVTNFNTSNVTNMGGMFYGCSDLTRLDVSHFDTSKVTDMGLMFRSCHYLTSLNITNFNTTKVTNMGEMFKDCKNLTSLDVTKFNTSKVTKMYGMFSGCSGLTTLDLSNFDTSNVTDMDYMFENCTNLISINLCHFDTSNVTRMRQMFSDCSGLKSLDVSNFDTSNVTNMICMFYMCNHLTILDLSHFDTRNVTNMNNENGYGMFQNCTKLTTIYVGENWNTDKVTASDNMFLNCTSLVGCAGTKYDANHTDVSYAHIDGGPSNPGYLTGKNTSPTLNLQEFVNANSGATNVVDVDLSKFYDTVRDATLNVSTGASYRFINGTLDRTGTFNGPVMLISKDSKVEIGSGAVVTGRSNYANGCETIILDGGTLNITQGVVEGALGYPANYYGNPCQTDAVLLTSPSDHFYLGDGEVYGVIACSAEGADIRLDKGGIMGFGLRSIDQNNSRRVSPTGSRSPSIITHSDIYINKTTSHDYEWGKIIPIGGQYEPETTHAFQITLYGLSILHLQNGYEKGYHLTLYDKHEGDVILVGENYNITSEDLENITVDVYYTESPPYIDDCDAYLELKGNKVYLRFKNTDLPTTGCDEDWLQKKLDEIAAQKPLEPVELTICEDGITLTRNILVDKDCKAVLTGGPITSEVSMDYCHGAEGVFLVYGELGFHDISLTFNNDAKKDGSLGYFWLGGGTLKMLENTVVNTTNGTVVGGWGQYELKSGVVSAGGNEMVIASGINADISGNVTFIGAQTYCNGHLSLDITISDAGYARIPTFRVTDIYVTSTLDIYAPLSTLPVYLYKDATINTVAGGIAVLAVDGEWDKMTPGHAVVTSPSITQKDYEGMTFANLPTNLKAEFVPEMHQVQLMTVGERNIQNDLDGLMASDQITPVIIDVASDAVSMLSQSTTVSHANVTFNGMQEGSASRGRLHFAKDQTLTVSQGSLVTLVNLDVTGEGGSECFVVKGRLLIGENVHVSGFTCFLRVQNGGSVAVSGHLVSNVTLRYASGLTDGQTVIAGTGGYLLTEQDLSFVHVEGCELKLDMANNRIVAVNSTSIYEIENRRLEMEDGYYDHSGRRVLSPHQGVYIMKLGGKTRKVYVK